MRRQIGMAVMTAIVLLLSGCGGQKGETPSPYTSAPASTGTSESPGTSGVSSKPNSTESILAIIQTKWSIFGNPQSSRSPRTEWVGVDDTDKVVVQGDLRQDTPRWLNDQDVSRVFVSEGLRGALSGQAQSFSIVTRPQFGKWPTVSGQGLPFVITDWPRYADWYGGLTVSGDDFTWASRNTQVQTWLKQRLGNRLVKAQLSHEDHITVNAVVQPGNLSDQDRVTEAATLQAGLDVTAGVQTLEIQYQGATNAKSIVVNDLSEWAKHGSENQLLRNCVEVDGVQGADCPVGQTPDPSRLSHLLDRRAALRAIVPQGAQLILADAGDPRVVLEASISDGQTWEQAWGIYSNVVDRVFSTAPETFEVELLLHRGSELEYFLVDQNRWAVRQFLTQKMGVTVEGTVLPWTANVYRRFQSTTP